MKLKCQWCSREMTCSPRSYEENPFCQKCLPDRMEAASKERGPVRMVECGNGYVMFVPLSQDGAAPRGQREGSRMGRESIFREIDEERARQDAKWGPVRRRPDVDPVIAAREGNWAQRIAEHHEIPTEARAKFLCQTAEARGECSFAAIVVEELAEAVAKYRDVEAMRVELVQLAACVVKWIEAIDLDTPAHPGEGSGSDAD